MNELKIPSFMKKKENNTINVGEILTNAKPIISKEFLEECEAKTYDESTTIPVYPIVPDLSGLSDEGTDNVVAGVTEEEKNKLKRLCAGMDEQRIFSVLDGIPMQVIIAYFVKKWSEAEKFEANILNAMQLRN